MKRKRVSKPKNRANKRIVIIIPDEIKERFPEVVKQITSLPSKQRGKLFVHTIIMAGIAMKEPNITKIIEGVATTSYAENKKKKNKKLKQSEATNDKLKGLEEIE